MSNQKLIVVLVAAMCIAITASPIWTRQQDGQSTTVQKEKGADDDAPIVDFNEIEAATSAEREQRKEKNKRYDSLGLVAEHEPGITVRPRSNHWSANVPAIPAAQSDVVVIGEIVQAKAYLSNDKTGVYSEFTIRISEVLKSDARAKTNNETVVAERVGGSVRFPSGQVQRIYVLYGQRMPEVGQRYLLFLKFTQGEQGLSILTGYKLHDSQVSALDSTTPYTNYDGTAELDFVVQVRERINSPAPEGMVERRPGK